MHRARLRWSQADLGEAVGLSANSISAVESANVDARVSVIQRIAKALDVSVAYLIGEDQTSETPPTAATRPRSRKPTPVR